MTLVFLDVMFSSQLVTYRHYVTNRLYVVSDRVMVMVGAGMEGWSVCCRHKRHSVGFN